MHVLLVGLGNMGNKYFQKLEELGERLILCDIDPSKAIGSHPFYCHFGEVQEELSCVIVAVNPREHVKIAKSFLSRGIPVLLEKPPALEPAEFETIMDSEGLYVSEVESYSVCTEFIRKPQKRLIIERFGRGKGYISPLWDLAWHDLYLLQKVSKDIQLVDLKVEKSLWRLEGYIENVPFQLSVAWEHPQPRRIWNIDDELILDFGNERVLRQGELLKDEKRDKLKIMLENFLSRRFDNTSVERAYRNIIMFKQIHSESL